MVEIRYGDLVQSSSALQVETVGSQPGPGGGDGWTLVATLPTNELLAPGSQQLAVHITGQIGNVQLAGGGALRGMLQLCVGTTYGAKLPHLRISVPVTEALGALQGIAFSFLVLISSAFPDPILGSSLLVADGASELCLYGRTYTNGDQQTYAATFTVADLSWLWLDLAAIPSTDWVADEFIPSPGTGLPTVLTGQRIAPVSAGAADETWLHFANVWYEARAHLLPAPVFEFGVTEDGAYTGFERKIGNRGRWGQNRFPSTANLAEVPQVQQGGFWVHVNAGSDVRAAVRAYAPGAPTRLFRYRHLALRIDTLLDVRHYSQAATAGGGVSILGDWRGVAQTTERPAEGILTQPIVMAHGVVTSAGRSGYGARILERDTDREIGQLTCFPQADAAIGEAVSSMAIGRRLFQVTSPAIQFRTAFVGDDTTPLAYQQLHDFCLVTWHPVRDPLNTGTGPGSRPPAILLHPGRQSADAASLAAPPVLPNAEVLERGSVDRQAIAGVNGYRRTWPTGARPARFFSVSWGPLTEVQAQQVFAFLVANPAWRYTPPRGAPLAVLSTTRPELNPASHRTFTVSVEVAVLLWTGGS